MKLYHGSHYLYDKLIPANIHGDPNFQGKKYVFASPVLKYALLFSGKKWSDRDFSVMTSHGSRDPLIHVTEMRPNAFTDIYNTSGYIYVMNSSKFHNYSKFEQYQSDWEYISEYEIKPEETIFYKNVLESLMNFPEIIFHDYNLNSNELIEAVKRNVMRAKIIGNKYLTWRLEGLDSDFINLYKKHLKQA